MSKPSVTEVIIILLALFMIFQSFKQSESLDDLLVRQDRLLQNINVAQDSIEALELQIRIIDSTKTIIRNNFYETITFIDSINDNDSLRNYIRSQIAKLGQPKI